MDDLLSMRWRNVLFAHWDVDPGAVRRRVPDQFALDTYDGRAHVGAVAFEMVDLRTVGSPFPRTFPQVNFRTYVTHRGDPGVYFFSLDAADPLVVWLSRRQGLPYYRAETRLRERDGTFEFACRRTHDDAPPARFVARYRPTGPVSTPDPGSLAASLVGRRRYYLVRDGRPRAGTVTRDDIPLGLVEATVESNQLFEAAGLPVPTSDPRFAYAAPDGLHVEAGGIDAR